MTDPYVAFAPYYDALYEPLVDYAGDVAWLEAIFARDARRPVRRVLDCGCGTGAHALRLARRGFEVDGVDLSEPLLAVARAKLAREPELAPRVRLHRGDMARDLPDGPFDAAISMFGAFNYLERDADARDFLRAVRERLAPGGALAFEFWNPIGARPQRGFVEQELGGGRRILRLSENEYETETDVVRLTMDHLVLAGDRLESRFVERHRLRARTQAAVRALLADAGYEVAAMTTGARESKTLDAAAFDAFRVMAVARRP